MRTLSTIAILLLSTRAWAQDVQQPYDEDDEQVQQQQQPYGYPPADPNAYAQQPQQMQYAYMGSHPVPYDVGGGYCYANGPHFHEYPPFDQYLFRESGGYFYFIGDPADFGYSAQMWGYNGNHPIPANWGGGYCYITWAHRHPYAPPSTVYFNFVGGYYVYGGPWDPWYWRYRDSYYGYYGGYYRTNYYGGRYWVVRPPPVYRPSLTVGAPGVRVYGGVRGPGVTVTAPGARVYAPAPRGYAPAPHVYAPAPRVYAPAPRVVAPAPHVYAPAPRVYAPAPAPVRPHYTPAPVHVAPPMRHR